MKKTISFNAPPASKPPEFEAWTDGAEAKKYRYRRDHESRVEHAQRCATGDQFRSFPHGIGRAQ